MGVSVVRVALARSGLNLGHLLEIAASLRPVSCQRRDPLGWAGRLIYFALARAGLARDRGHGMAPPPYPKEALDRAARSLEPLAKRAAELGLSLGVENHWGISGRPDDLLYTMGRLRDFGLGACLDLDNFYRDRDALDGVAALASQAVHVHYKAHGVDARAEAPGSRLPGPFGGSQGRGLCRCFQRGIRRPAARSERGAAGRRSVACLVGAGG